MQYKVLSTLKHNGEVYEAGSIIDLEADEAEVLTTTVEAVDDGTPQIEVNVKVESNEPSMDWTRSRLAEYATELGIEVNANMSKAKILAAIQATPAQTEASEAEETEETSEETVEDETDEDDKE